MQFLRSRILVRHFWEKEDVGIRILSGRFYCYDKQFVAEFYNTGCNEVSRRFHVCTYLEIFFPFLALGLFQNKWTLFSPRCISFGIPCCKVQGKSFDDTRTNCHIFQCTRSPFSLGNITKRNAAISVRKTK